MYVHTYLRSYLRVSPNTLEPVLCTRMKHIVCCVFIHLGAQVRTVHMYIHMSLVVCLQIPQCIMLTSKNVPKCL